MTMTQELHNELIFVGYTNGYQIKYAKEEEGFFFKDTDGECFIPLYMLKCHAHRTLGVIELDESGNVIKDSKED